MNISVFGLGYVGSVTAACLANNGHHVIGVDIKKEKVDTINNGFSPIIEKGLDALINKTVTSGRLKASSSVETAIGDSNCSLICVGTPSNIDGSINLDHLKRVCQDIGIALKDKKEYHVVTIRSTVIPGTTEKILIPILEKSSGKKHGSDFGVCTNPEFLREGQAIKDFYDSEMIVIGRNDEEAALVLEEMYRGIDAPIYKVDIKTAEMIKYANNSFHGLKVAFANEIGVICKKLGLDGRDVMEIFCKDHKLNLSPYYLKPGFAFGGSCIPKDLRAILHKSKELELETPVIDSIMKSNDRQIERAVELIAKTEKRRIGIFGLAFKEGTEDLRESPTIPLITKLLEKGYLKLFDKGYSIKVYDPMVKLKEVEETLPHIAALVTDSIDGLLLTSDVLVITKRDAGLDQIIKKVKKDQILIDLAGIIDSKDISDIEYHGICW